MVVEREADLAALGEAIARGGVIVVAGLAADGPLALVVDDAQWADEASLRFLAYLAPRLEGLPVTVLLGVRHESGPTGVAPLDALLGAGALRPEALSPDGVAEV